jgi:hypothetical protein
MYRYVRHVPLATGQKYGDIIKDGDLKQSVIDKMLASGTLVKISMPPLTELPHWESRAKILNAANVTTVSDLLLADVDNLAKKLKKPVKIIKNWQDEVTAWLRPPVTKEPG